MDSHATRNVLKWRQDFIDGRLGTVVIGPSSPSSIKANCPSPTFRLAIPPSSNIGPLERPMTKHNMLQLQSRSFATMASCFQVSLEICDALLVTKMDINHERKNKVKISNLKVAQKLRIILEEEFRAQVKACPHI
jgi:hypothetical protein